MKTFPKNLFSSFPIRSLMGAASMSLLLSVSAQETIPCGNGETKEDEDCGCAEGQKPCPEDPAGNSSYSEYGPIMKIPTGGSGMPPKTNQKFFQTNGSNGISSALDLEIEATTSLLPLKFERQYQSRIQQGTGDSMGHGVTWTHSYSYRLWVSGTNKRSILFPNGTLIEFTPGGNVTFEGATYTEHLPTAGKGARMYQGGTGSNWFILVMPNGHRHVFERVTTGGTSLYHQRWSADAEGRRQTYTTDSKARIIKAEDAGGNSISLTYAGIQIDRKSNILLATLYQDPSQFGWTEMLRPTTGSFRWFQLFSSGKDWCSFAEIEFWGLDSANVPYKMSGTPYGTGPARYDTATFDKAFDGNTSTVYWFARPMNGLAGIDLGAGNEQRLYKVNFKIGPVSNDLYKGLKLEACVKQPEIIEVLQKVEASDGREVNFLYNTIDDESINQQHLVLTGVDYDGDGLATSATDARFTYTFSLEGAGPSIETIYEPRTLGSVPFLKYEYLGATVDPRGMVSKVINPENNEVLVENIPQAPVRTVRFPGGREIKVDYPNESARFREIKDASGGVTRYGWDPLSKLLQSTTDQAGRTTEYTFNSRSQRTLLKRPDGFQEASAFDGSGRMISVTQSAPNYVSRATTWTRNAEGKATRKDYPDASYETFTYNSLGLVTEKRERNGSITQWTYDTTGLALSRTRALGAPEEETVSYTYYGLNDPTGSPARFLKTLTDERGRVTCYEYNTRGQITKTTYPDGSYRTKTYDAFGNVLTESDGVDSRSWTYNGYKQVTTQTDPLGHMTQYYYGDGGIPCGCYNNGGPTMIVSAEGRMTLREYDEQWRLIAETIGHGTPESATTHTFYDAVGNVEAKSLPGGVTHMYGYDARNRKISETVEGGGLQLTTTWVFDPFGNRLSETRPGSRVTVWSYDVMERIETITDAIGTVTQLGYDLAGNRVSEIKDFGGPLAKTTTTGYDLLNRLISTTNPDASSQSVSYHPGGDVHTRTDELGRTTSIADSLVSWADSKGISWSSFVVVTTDPAGKIWRKYPKPLGRFAGTNMAVTPMGRTQETYFNADGTIAEKRTGLIMGSTSVPSDVAVTTYSYDQDHLMLSKTVDPSGLNEVTSFTYDARGNRLTVTDPLNRTTASEYDLRGNLVKKTLSDNRKTVFTFDSLNRKTTETDSENRVTTWSYFNEISAISMLRDGKNQITTWAYNPLGRPVNKIYPNGDTDVFTYDSLNRLATHRTPKNETCTYSYDLLDRLTLSDWNTATPDTSREYLANGLLKSIDNGVSRSDYSYGVRSELLAEVVNGVGSVTYSYDDDRLRAEMSSSLGAGSGPAITYGWNARGLLTNVSSDGPPPLVTYSHDKAGRITSVNHENGISEVKTYNAAGDLQANNHYLGGALVDGHGYTYDATGRRVAETFADGVTPSRIYGYDGADQLTSAIYGGGLSDSYAYDAAENRTQATVASLGGISTFYTANAANQYTAITGQAVPTYDANGNLTTTRGSTLIWDSENRLLSVADATTKVEYTYDGRGRRVSKKVTDLPSNAIQSHTRFLYDGWNVIGEADLTAPTINFARAYTWGVDLSGSLQGTGGVGGLLMVEEIGSSTAAYHFHYDGGGNVTRVSDSAGTSVASYRYDAFGNTLAANGAYASANRYRFSTKPLDAEIPAAPLYYYGYRYYDSLAGKWTARDPIGEIGGSNPYHFVSNSPSLGVDLMGLATVNLNGQFSGSNLMWQSKEEMFSISLGCDKGPNCSCSFEGKVTWKEAHSGMGVFYSSVGFNVTKREGKECLPGVGTSQGGITGKYGDHEDEIDDEEFLGNLSDAQQSGINIEEFLFATMEELGSIDWIGGGSESASGASIRGFYTSFTVNLTHPITCGSNQGSWTTNLSKP